MEPIEVKINRLYSQFNGKKPGDPNTRYASWEYCHQTFISKRKDYKNAVKKSDSSAREEIIDFLSLHLAFYLASWGMYRGSSFWLQRDYKTHRKVVEKIMEEKYDSLCDYNPCNFEDKQNETVIDLLFENENGLYDFIKNAYKYKINNQNVDVATHTQITKILLGTLACIPAFDSYLVDAVNYIRKNEIEIFENGNSVFTKALYANTKDGGISKDAIKVIFKNMTQLITTEPNAFSIKNNPLYSPMKCLDMYLWQIGYELRLIKQLEDDKVSREKKKEIIIFSKNIKLISSNTSDYDFLKAINMIKSKNKKHCPMKSLHINNKWYKSLISKQKCRLYVQKHIIF